MSTTTRTARQTGIADETRPWKVTGARQIVLDAIADIPFALVKDGRRWYIELIGYEDDWFARNTAREYSESTKRDTGSNVGAFAETIADTVLNNEVHWHHNSGSPLAVHLLNVVDPTHELFHGWSK